MEQCKGCSRGSKGADPHAVVHRGFAAVIHSRAGGRHVHTGHVVVRHGIGTSVHGHRRIARAKHESAGAGHVPRGNEGVAEQRGKQQYC
jgi:hypothetical protein